MTQPADGPSTPLEDSIPARGAQPTPRGRGPGLPADSGDHRRPDEFADPALVVGLGFRPGTRAEQIVHAVESVVGDTAAISCLATIDRRATEPGIEAAAGTFGIPVIGFSAAQLAETDAPYRSPLTAQFVGTPNVAEAAALLAGSGELVCGRTVVDGVVVAVATAAGRPN
ncbi:cobalamin biosynthesis protein [Nocardia sp. NPDC055029]